MHGLCVRACSCVYVTFVLVFVSGVRRNDTRSLFCRTRDRTRNISSAPAGNRTITRHFHKVTTGIISFQKAASVHIHKYQETGKWLSFRRVECLVCYLSRNTEWRPTYRSLQTGVCQPTASICGKLYGGVRFFQYVGSHICVHVYTVSLLTRSQYTYTKVKATKSQRGSRGTALLFL
jgi:hypothetical protein